MLRSCLWLTAVVVAALLIVGGALAATRGRDAVVAAAVAAGICWAGSTIALIAAARLGTTNRVLQAHLLGMFFRLGLPLGAGMALQAQQGFLAKAGVFGLIVVFYLVTLVAETLLSLRFVQKSPTAPRA